MHSSVRRMSPFVVHAAVTAALAWQPHAFLPPRHPNFHGIQRRGAPCVTASEANGGDGLSEEERRTALRLPERAPAADDGSVEWRDDTGDPLGGGDYDAEMFAQASYRVRRRAAAGEYNSTSPSRDLPLIALVAQVGLGGTLCAALCYSWVLNYQADLGTAWAVEALSHSDEWWFGWFGRLWGRPPGGPLTLLYAAGNGINAVRCAPQLFDRLVVTRAPRSEDSNASAVSEEGQGEV